jgi:hypothetical protein
MKITLKGVLNVLRALLPFLPGGSSSPHAGVKLGTVAVVTASPAGSGPVIEAAHVVVVNVDAAFLAGIPGAEEISRIVDPSNAVLLVASGANADVLRKAVGLDTVAPVP